MQAAGGAALTGPSGQHNGGVTDTTKDTPPAEEPAETAAEGDAPAAVTADVAAADAVPAGPRRVGLLAVVAAVVLLADVLSKVAVVATLSDRGPVKLFGGLVYLVEARNAGAAFSFAQSATVVFTVIAAVVVAVILRTASQLRSLPWAISLGLILGGAMGNLTDRLFRSPGPLRGRVVDWISLRSHGNEVWPVFNVADSSIVVGGLLAVLLAFIGYELNGHRTRGRS